MTLPLSGNSISLKQISTEFSDPSPYDIRDLYRGGSYVPSWPPSTANVPTSGTIKFSNFYGAAAATRVPLLIEIPGNYVGGYNVWSNAVASPAFSNGITDITVNVQAGVAVYGYGVSLAAMTIPAPLLSAGNKVTLNVHGLIVGTGGYGGSSYVAGGGGQPGGGGAHGLYVEAAPSAPPASVYIDVKPTGGIASGGGGGGSGAPLAFTVPRPPKSGGPYTAYQSGGGGGGGAGLSPGSAGNPNGGYATGSTPVPSSYPFGLTAGAGGPGFPSPAGSSGAGGAGGALGSNGTPGSNTITGIGGTGGPAGWSIRGVNRVTLDPASPPRIYGTSVNS